MIQDMSALNLCMRVPRRRRKRPDQPIASTHFFLYRPAMKSTAHPDTVLIVDFGSQVTQLIARRVREAGVYSEIVPFQKAEAAFKRINPKAVILSGGPA